MRIASAPLSLGECFGRLAGEDPVAGGGEFLGVKTATFRERGAPFASRAALRGPTWFILAFAELSADAVREVTRR